MSCVCEHLCGDPGYRDLGRNYIMLVPLPTHTWQQGRAHVTRLGHVRFFMGSYPATHANMSLACLHPLAPPV
jgi:hypothetical protein